MITPLVQTEEVHYGPVDRARRSQVGKGEKCREAREIENLWEIKAHFVVILVADGNPAVHKYESGKKDHHECVGPQDSHGYLNIRQDLSDELHKQTKRFARTWAKFESDHGLVHSHSGNPRGKDNPNNVRLSKKERIHSHNGRWNMIVPQAKIVHEHNEKCRSVVRVVEEHEEERQGKYTKGHSCCRTVKLFPFFDLALVGLVA